MNDINGANFVKNYFPDELLYMENKYWTSNQLLTSWLIIITKNGIQPCAGTWPEKNNWKQPETKH